MQRIWDKNKKISKEKIMKTTKKQNMEIKKPEDKVTYS